MSNKHNGFIILATKANISIIIGKKIYFSPDTGHKEALISLFLSICRQNDSCLSLLEISLVEIKFAEIELMSHGSLFLAVG